jgi:NAD(P)-dependent dehydrogenase (short-subunit alcohol dehydrogenase family)
MKLKDKNVIIIGASQGIGKALAEAYADAGASLVLLSRNTAAQYALHIHQKGEKLIFQDVMFPIMKMLKQE